MGCLLLHLVAALRKDQASVGPNEHTDDNKRYIRWYIKTTLKTVTVRLPVLSRILEETNAQLITIEELGYIKCQDWLQLSELCAVYYS